MRAGDIVVLKERFKRVRKGFVLRPEPNFSSPIGPNTGRSDGLGHRDKKIL